MQAGWLSNEICMERLVLRGTRHKSAAAKACAWRTRRSRWRRPCSPARRAQTAPARWLRRSAPRAPPRRGGGGLRGACRPRQARRRGRPLRPPPACSTDTLATSRSRPSAAARRPPRSRRSRRIRLVLAPLRQLLVPHPVADAARRPSTRVMLQISSCASRYASRSARLSSHVRAGSHHAAIDGGAWAAAKRDHDFMAPICCSAATRSFVRFDVAGSTLYLRHCTLCLLTQLPSCGIVLGAQARCSLRRARRGTPPRGAAPGGRGSTRTSWRSSRRRWRRTRR